MAATLPRDATRTLMLLHSTLTSAHEIVRSLAITAEISPSLLRPIKKNLAILGPTLVRFSEEQVVLEQECRRSRVSLEEVRRKEDELTEMKAAWDRLCEVLSSHGKSKHLIDDVRHSYPTLFDAAARSGTDAGQQPSTASPPYKDNPGGTAQTDSDLAEQNRNTFDSQAQQFVQQDAQLDVLAASIGRQHHLSLQMNEELDTHAGLLDDLDNRLDGTQARLTSASQRLNRFTDSVREHGSTWTIFGLIIVLVMLIALFK